MSILLSFALYSLLLVTPDGCRAAGGLNRRPCRALWGPRCSHTSGESKSAEKRRQTRTKPACVLGSRQERNADERRISMQERRVRWPLLLIPALLLPVFWGCDLPKSGQSSSQ